MIISHAPVTSFLTPQDNEVPIRLVELIDAIPATGSLRFMLYSAALGPFHDALIRAHVRGVDIRGIFDHSEASTPIETAMLHRLFLAVPATLFRIGTSPVDHQLVHLKGLWTGCTAAAVPSAEAITRGAAYAGYGDAVQAGDPVVWRGSWNVSESATKQYNNVDISACPILAAAFQATFDLGWAWIDTHEQAYQPAKT